MTGLQALLDSAGVDAAVGEGVLRGSVADVAEEAIGEVHLLDKVPELRCFYFPITGIRNIESAHSTNGCVRTLSGGD